MDKKNEILAEAEQIEATMQSIARIVSAYHTELIANGIEEGLAEALTTQFSEIFHMQMFNNMREGRSE